MIITGFTGLYSYLKSWFDNFLREFWIFMEEDNDISDHAFNFSQLFV